RLTMSGELNVDALMHARRYEAILKMQAAELSKQMQQVLEEVERRRTALSEADRDVKSLEKLRERQHLAYEAIQSKRDDQLIDAAAIRRFREQREGVAE